MSAEVHPSPYKEQQSGVRPAPLRTTRKAPAYQSGSFVDSHDIIPAAHVVVGVHWHHGCCTLSLQRRGQPHTPGGEVYYDDDDHLTHQVVKCTTTITQALLVCAEL